MRDLRKTLLLRTLEDTLWGPKIKLITEDPKKDAITAEPREDPITEHPREDLQLRKPKKTLPLRTLNSVNWQPLFCQICVFLQVVKFYILCSEDFSTKILTYSQRALNFKVRTRWVLFVRYTVLTWIDCLPLATRKNWEISDQLIVHLKEWMMVNTKSFQSFFMRLVTENCSVTVFKKYLLLKKILLLKSNWSEEVPTYKSTFSSELRILKNSEVSPPKQWLYWKIVYYQPQKVLRTKQ